MWSWLTKIDPNTVIGIVAAVGLFVWHKVAPANAQTAVDHAIASVKAVLITVVQTEAAGKTPQAFEVELRGFAAVQLAKLNIHQPYPYVVSAAVEAAIHEALAVYTEK